MILEEYQKKKKKPEDVDMILEESHDISLFKLLNSPPTMLAVQYIIDL
jgi:hypothetical protein